MILAALLLQATAPVTALDAERAFNAAAQAKGQWTAFREFAAEDAIVFTPKPERAQQALPTKDPSIAVQWWPAASFVSCDDKVAVNTGSWVRPKGFGYFTTVWVRQSDGNWKWAVDHGDDLARPRSLPPEPKVRRASCKDKPPSVIQVPIAMGKTGAGQSPDGTLRWRWDVNPKGDRVLNAELWNGRAFEPVIADRVGDWK